MKRECQRCGRKFSCQRSSAKWCSDRCKMQNHFDPRPRSTQVVEIPVADHPLVIATRRELEAAGALNSPLAAAAIILAEVIADPATRGAGMAAASRELSKTMAAALGRKPTVARAPDPVDELTVRRSQRQKRGYRRRPSL